jgi:hypothetical protein
LKSKFGTLNPRWTVGALILTTCVLFSHDSVAQIQQAWVARYDNGINYGTNQALKMALDPAGNIYIVGVSQNANSQLGYATIKYAANGTQLWAARFDSTNYPSATPAAFVLDKSNNVIVTGNALTVKYDSNGNQLWIAPYYGTSVAVDAGGNVGITGGGTSFGSVKLNLNGSNLWTQASPSTCGPAVAQAVIADAIGNFYVAGSYPDFCERSLVDYELLINKYSANGSQTWSSSYQTEGGGFANVSGVAVDCSNNLYLAVISTEGLPMIMKYLSNGSSSWVLYPTIVGSVGYGGNIYGLTIDTTGDVLLTGQVGYLLSGGNIYDGPFIETYGTYKADTNGVLLWSSNFPVVEAPPSAGLAIAVDLANNCYVTGYSPGNNSSNDIVTIKYDQSGKQIWMQRYGDPVNGNAVGNAIAVDNNGNVYVTGYETTAAGGTEMVVIKYSPLSLQLLPNGSVLLQAEGLSGENFNFLGSTDLLNWLNLGSVTADSNGVAEFTDTNADQYNWRFYVTLPQ